MEVNTEKKKALEIAMSQIEKQFGKGSVMKLGEFNLLEVDVYNGEDLIYNGVSNDMPDDLKSKHIEIIGIDGKKVITKIVQ